MTGGGYRDEDVQFKPVAGPPSYGYTAEGPVRYVVVANANGVLGYLWASDADDAAGFEPRRDAGDDPFNAAVAWTQRLRPAKARGIAPSRALAELASEQGSAVNGWVVAGSEGIAPNLATLKDLAGG